MGLHFKEGQGTLSIKKFDPTPGYLVHAIKTDTTFYAFFADGTLRILKDESVGEVPENDLKTK